MSSIFLTIYLLSFPVIVAGVLILLIRAFWQEWLKARRKGRSII